MSELADFFCQKDEFEVHMVLYGKNPELFYHVPKDLIIHEPITVFNDNLRLFNTFGRLLYLRKKIKSIKPISILSFGEFWNNFVLIALFGLQFPVYVSDRCQPDYSLGKFHDFLRKLLYPRAAGVIVQTRKAKEIYHKMFPNANLTFIGNPIRSIPRNPEIQKENIILSVGMLISCKHFDSLIKLFAEINMSGWKLVIVGDDANKQQNKAKLQALIKELHFEDRIHLTGLRSDIDNFYRKSKIFAFTSGSEGFPNVIGEAMAAGLPVVAFDCVAGPSEMITDGIDGFLVPMFDFKQFKDRLSTLMNDNLLSERLGNEAMKSIERFSVDVIGREYYSNIVPGK